LFIGAINNDFRGSSGPFRRKLFFFSTAASAGRCRWVESHSDLVCYRLLGMRSVKNGELFEDIPARSFHRLAKHALQPVKHGRRVRPTGTARHGSVLYRHRIRHRPARVCSLPVPPRHGTWMIQVARHRFLDQPDTPVTALDPLMTVIIQYAGTTGFSEGLSPVVSDRQRLAH
jgi:hypothetical protein